MNSGIYREMILEHYKNPSNSGVILGSHVTAKDSNPSCGDEIEIQIKFDDGKIEDVKFQGQGCAISLSFVDILIDLVKDKDVDYARSLTPDEFLKNLRIELSPLRLKCALLGLKTLKTAVYTYLGRQE